MAGGPHGRATDPVGVGGAPLDDADVMRAQFWSLLGALLTRPPSQELLDRVAGLGGDRTPLGNALRTLAARAVETDERRAEREYHGLFIGVARGELLPYASYYITGFLNEKPLARLRQDMAALGIERAAGNKDPEDHIGSLCEMMAGLIAGEFATDLAHQRAFFDRHIAPWAGRFFADLEKAENALLYQPVGTAGRLFMGIEAEGFALGA
ncbi:TorD/DmsD family molecular chaperone [Indioceanicola profundi]|uniref:TorD/DmsD family molecular chaperone n=1 Tax=Indioceanicola profundi TaxID=2220096 RepID=UPI001968FA95|nr:molecular chaperone TorD family protein [Indioceanicola profundi]